MNVIYLKKINLYDKSFLIEYNRVLELTKKINEEIGLPIFRVKIDIINSELKVENRFLYKKNKQEFKNLFKGSNLSYAR